MLFGDSYQGNYRLDLLGGVRYLNLNEGLALSEQTRYANDPAFGNLAGTSQQFEDHFNTLNQFVGGQLGLDAHWRLGNWSLAARAKVGLGETTGTVTINGSNTIRQATGQVLSFPSGLLAQPSNEGNHNRTVFSVVPEVGLDLGYQVTRNLRAFVGYNFLYWTGVVRPGEQIDTVLNSSQMGQAQPATSLTHPMVLFRQSDFWVQGITVGLEFRY